MTDQLEDLVRSAGAGRAPTVEPEALVARGRARRRRRRAGRSLLVLLLALGVVVVIIRASEPSAVVLDAPPSRLPEALRGSDIDEALAEEQLAQTLGAGAYYTARGPDGAVCLLRWSEGPSGTATACTSRSLFDARGHLPLEIVGQGERIWAAYVGDGWAQADALGSVVPVLGGVAVFDPIPTQATAVELTGPAGERSVPIVVDLDPGRSDRAQPEPSPLLPGVVPTPFLVEVFPEREATSEAAASSAGFRSIDIGCTSLGGLTSLESEQALARRGLTVTWRRSVVIGGGGAGLRPDGNIAPSFTYGQSAPPLGQLSDVFPRGDGLLVAFVSPLGEPAAEVQGFCPDGPGSHAVPVAPDESVDLTTPAAAAAGWARAYDAAALRTLWAATAPADRPGTRLEDFWRAVGTLPIGPIDEVDLRVELVEEPDDGTALVEVGWAAGRCWRLRLVEQDDRWRVAGWEESCTTGQLLPGGVEPAP